ncbi:hypothetical protein LIER_14817 [Lithospermum erythrorhizon]|uniref:Helitron helicase-like domain-containing protein n=1 Tax=Lithospermum erythrorhizon TaxID=34254 RepID=A0AAV3Q315_LITER
MTCNPNWPEIKERLKPKEESQNRPDLLARVFKAKLRIMIDKIMSGEVFGKIASVVHVVEFQKRGLPHAHFLIILKAEFKYMSPEAYDRIVCAELPDQKKDPYLYSLVVKHMMHGPCGEFNVDSVRGQNLDNLWVIPYNPTLLVQFNCHINVEICCDIRAVKYLYKYVHKGHDKVMFRISADNSTSEVDEISSFQNARWVSPVEAAWRIYGFHFLACTLRYYNYKFIYLTFKQFSLKKMMIWKKS